jgi:hypothetical protein
MPGKGNGKSGQRLEESRKIHPIFGMAQKAAGGDPILCGLSLPVSLRALMARGYTLWASNNYSVGVSVTVDRYFDLYSDFRYSMSGIPKNCQS